MPTKEITPFLRVKNEDVKCYEKLMDEKESANKSCAERFLDDFTVLVDIQAVQMKDNILQIF